jgi:hypothetical protein
MTMAELEHLKSFAACCLRLHLSTAASGGARAVETHLDADLRTVHVYLLSGDGSWAAANFQLAQPVTQEEFERDHRDAIEAAFHPGGH